MNIYTRFTILQFGMYETDILNISNNDRILLYYPSRFNKSFFIESLSTISQNFPYLLYASSSFRCLENLLLFQQIQSLIYLIIFDSILRCSGWRYDQRQVRFKKTTQTSYADQVMLDVLVGFSTKRFRLSMKFHQSCQVLFQLSKCYESF